MQCEFEPQELSWLRDALDLLASDYQKNKRHFTDSKAIQIIEKQSAEIITLQAKLRDLIKQSIE